MAQSKEDFLKELLNDFKIEASEHLQAIVSGLLELEKSISSTETPVLIERIFRETHSMKGAARAVNLLKIERLCMSLEGVFHAIKNNTLALSTSMFDVFFQSTDMLDGLLTDLTTEQTTVSENAISLITQKLAALSDPKNKTATPQVLRSLTPGTFTQVRREEPINEEASATLKKQDEVDNEKIRHTAIGSSREYVAENSINKPKNENDTIRVATSKLIDLLQLAEEMIVIKSELEFYSNQMQSIANQVTQCRRQYLDQQAVDCFGVEIIKTEEKSKDKEQIKRIESDLVRLNKSLGQLQRSTERSVDDVIQNIKQTLLQPFSSLFVVVPRIVRDLSGEYKKEIALEINGGEIEIDRRILEQMKDPVIHLIRNCIDHGIETPEQRIRNNKPSTGKLSIDVHSDTDQKVHIVVQDDGAGIDLQKVIASSIKAGLIKTEEVKSLSQKELANLIFGSGVSTSPFITDVSGRGLGMAIVTDKINGLGGSIEIDTHPGKGTTFTITLPQTLTTFRGILVKASDSSFLVPTTSVVKALRIMPAEILTIESKKALKIQNETIGLVGLSDVLNLPKRHSRTKRTSLQGLLLQHAQKKLIFIIEEVSGEHQGVVKPLGPQLKHVRNITGVSLLGDGSIAPVLNIPELLSTAAGRSYNSDNGISSDQEKERAIKQILVAEDSITIRNMLRNYLESAGFAVKTTVDGQEAYELLQTESFDIVVSDVEMPRMNGFELTTKIRKDLTHSHLPVILVTALDSPDDRSRGMDAGANAYIVKSSFEKSNLIETINRLI
jgi:two-component system chemotaxis sensor kinase CheA